MKILFLDDEEYRHVLFDRNSIGHQVKHVYNAEDCVNELLINEFDAVFLDHDLSLESQNTLPDEDEALDGRWVCRQLIGDKLLLDRYINKRFILHSLNDEARGLMFDI
jgi:hypothetical protein